MIMEIPELNLNEKEWMDLLKKCLDTWTEIPLSTTAGYDIDVLRFYDGIIGLLLKRAEQYENTYFDNNDRIFIDSWKYQGKLYRVIHQCVIKSPKNEDKHSCRLPKVRYHRMITHWTSDYTFSGLYKLSKNRKYIILEADTKEHYGFDVNKFRKQHHCERKNTEAENEIIFPMYKECIKEYHMTINEFIAMKNKEK